MIVGVAFRLENSVQFVSLLKPHRHHHIIKVMSESGNYTRGDIARAEQGFITDKNEFLNRKQGAEYALNNKQISKLQWPPNLYSEDLW